MKLVRGGGERLDLGCFGLSWAPLGSPGLSWALPGPLLGTLGSPGLSWALGALWPQVLQGPLQNGPFSIAAARKTRCVTLGSFGFAGTQNSHSRCESIVNSAFQALRCHSKFAFSLRIYSEFCIPSASLELKIRILAANL